MTLVQSIKGATVPSGALDPSQLSLLSRIFLALVLGLVLIVEDMGRTLKSMLSYWEQKRIRKPHPDLLFQNSLELVVEELPFGFGAFTSIFRAHRAGKSPQILALKVWRLTGSPDAQDYTQYYNVLEARLLTWKNLNHPNIDPILGVSEGMGYIPALITNHYALGNVNQYLASHPSADKLEILLGISSALSYLHHQEPPLPHGDLRGCNILITDDGKPVLTDIGISNIPRPPDWTIATGESTRWMAPEIMAPDPQPSRIEDYIYATVASDIYSFGMTILEIYTGRPPYAHRRFYGPVVFDVVNKIRPPRPIVSELKDSDDIWEIITSCWEHDAQRRPNIDTVSSWLRVISGMRKLRG